MMTWREESDLLICLITCKPLHSMGTSIHRARHYSMYSRLRELEEQYKKEKEESEQLFQKQRTVSFDFDNILTVESPVDSMKSQ